MKTRQQALEAFKQMTTTERLDLWQQSDHKHWNYALFQCSSSAIEAAINKKEAAE